MTERSLSILATDKGAQKAEDLFRIGAVTKTHGLKGEMKVYPYTDDRDMYSSLKTVFIEDKRTKEKSEKSVRSVRFQNNIVLLSLSGTDSIEDAQGLVGDELYIRRSDAGELSENEYFVYDLIGMTVFSDTGEKLGQLSDVLETGANDVYVIETGKRQILIPAVREFVLSVDVPGKKMTVHLLKEI